MKKIFPVVLLSLLLLACGDGRQPTPISEKEAKEMDAGSVKPSSTPASGGYGSERPASNENSSATSGVEKPASLAELEKVYESSKSEENKKKLAQATYEFGNKVMNDESLPPRVKYPEARRLFIKTLQLNPEHEQAAAEKKMIEDIYASMGRPVPE